MQEILGSFEETTPGTLTIPHSSGKDIEVINIQEMELHSTNTCEYVPWILGINGRIWYTTRVQNAMQNLGWINQ